MRPTRKLTKHEREVLNLEHALLRPGLPTGYVWRNHWQTRVPLLPCPEPDARSPATGLLPSTIALELSPAKAVLPSLCLLRQLRQEQPPPPSSSGLPTMQATTDKRNLTDRPAAQQSPHP